MPNKKQVILNAFCEKAEAMQNTEEKKNALDDRLGLQKLELGALGGEYVNLGGTTKELAAKSGVREELVTRWIDATGNWPDNKRPKDVVVSFSVYEELDGPDRFMQMAELVKMAKKRAANTGKKPRIIVNDIRELQGKKLTRYAPPPRTAEEKAKAVAEYLADPIVAAAAVSDLSTRTAITGAFSSRSRELQYEGRRNERSNFPLASESDDAWVAEQRLQKSVHLLQEAYDLYADLGQLSDNNRSRAQQLVAQVQLVASYLDSLVNGGQPLDVALDEILGG